MKKSVLQLALFLLLSQPLLSLAHGFSSSYCKHTTYPQICLSAMNAFRATHVANLNAEAVLKMHLGAISHRSVSASRTAKKLMRRAKPSTRVALKHCAELYRGKIDMVGESLRELHSKDSQTKQMLRIMVQMLRQSAQECDLQFQHSGISNPLIRFNRSIFKLAINCNDLNNMMT